MPRKNIKRKVKPIAAHVTIKIWDELKVQAIREGRKTGEVLDDAIKMYIEKRKDLFGVGDLFG